METVGKVGNSRKGSGNLETAEKAEKETPPPAPPHENPARGEGSGYVPRPWRCEGCGAVLGRVVRPGVVRRLEVWASPPAVGGDGSAGSPPTVLVVMTGPGEVRCRCGCVRAWSVGGDAMRELLRRRG